MTNVLPIVNAINELGLDFEFDFLGSLSNIPDLYQGVRTAVRNQGGIYCFMFYDPAKVLHIYFGQATEFIDRLYGHFTDFRAGETTHLYNSFRAHGIENFYYGVIAIATGASPFFLDLLEYDYMNYYKGLPNIKVLNERFSPRGPGSSTTSKAITIFDNELKKELKFESQREAARVLKVDKKTIYRAIISNKLSFYNGRYTIRPDPNH